jgi:hypothetical protein
MMDATLGAAPSSPANGGVHAPSAVANGLEDEELSVDDDELIDE